MLRGEHGQAEGWFGRARRLLDREGADCVERGYLRIPLMFRHEAAGDLEAAVAVAADAAATGERFGDPDLFALAAHSQGALLVKQGRTPDGLALMDEAMLAVTAGELSPIASGLVYCGVILGCQEAYEPRRAQEWTTALTHWCEQQPDMVAFTGRCLTHRAEIMCLHGAWEEALDEARRAGRRCAQGNNELAGGEAAYVQGEVHRLRGELAAAEEAYRDASRHGREPQPGLALLRLAQGNGEVAAAAIRRALAEAARAAAARPAAARLRRDHARRRRCRRGARAPAPSSSGSPRARRAACWTRWRRTPVARSTWPTGDARAALVALRRAARIWQQLEAPYEAARSRALVGLACRALGGRRRGRVRAGGGPRRASPGSARRPIWRASRR